MHHFRVRNKSDAPTKRSAGSALPAMPLPVSTPPPTLDQLPPASDFRTSPILPRLSRRLTLLRDQNGEPLSIDDVRSRLAYQRATGHPSQVTEEEEKIMIDALLRAHSIDPTAMSGSDSDSEGYTTATGYERPADPASLASKRNSGNMFGSASFGDQSYIRGAARGLPDPPPSHLTVAGPRKTTLSTPSAPVHLPAAPGEEFSFDAYLSDSQFSPAQIQRASLALQDSIQEFDEESEEDEQILVPRSGPLAGGSQPQPEPHQDEPHAHHGEGRIGYGEAIPWPGDRSGPVGSSSTATMPYSRLATAQRIDTVNRLPGYIPGMHRPITPRKSAVDTDTGGASTPQPSSAVSTSSPRRTERALPQSILLNKRGSTSNTPLRLRPRQTITGDSYDHLGGSSSDSPETPLKLALSDRRRPVLPLVDSAYQSVRRTRTPSGNLMDAWSPTAVSFAASTPPSRTASLAGAGSAPSSKDSHSGQVSGASTNMETLDSHPSSSLTSGANGARSTAPLDWPTINSSSGLSNIVNAWSSAPTISQRNNVANNPQNMTDPTLMYATYGPSIPVPPPAPVSQPDQPPFNFTTLQFSLPSVSGPDVEPVDLGISPPRRVKVVSSTMPAHEMFECLLRHGCFDLSSIIDPKHYSSVAIAGGSFGDIWRGKTRNGIEVAIKSLRSHVITEVGAKGLKRAMRELYMWSKAKHENVHELMGIIMFQDRLGMVSPWMENGNLQEYIQKSPGVDRYKLCSDVAAGVEYLHGIGMVHGDLKALNILVSHDGTAKLSDFDHSILSDCTLLFSSTTNVGGGTLRWMAPELLLREEDDKDDEDEEEMDPSPGVMRNTQTDVYSLGMTMLEILTGKVPYFKYKENLAILRALDRKEPPARPKVALGSDRRSDQMWALLLQCWDHDPAARPEAPLVRTSLQQMSLEGVSII